MIDLQAVSLFVILPICLVGGLVLGIAYFHTLRLTADLLVRGNRPLLAVALTLGRFLLLGAGLYAAVLGGGLALLAALAGVLLAKWIMLRGIRGTST